MDTLFLLKPGELMLKGANRPFFMRVLRKNLSQALREVPHRLEDRHSRILVRVAEADAPRTADILRRFIGISGFSPALVSGKSLDDIEHTASLLVGSLLRERGTARYKIEARRADKSYPLDSYGIACELGERLGRRFPDLTVSMREPDFILHVEIRGEVFLYALAEEGERGLPVGVSGRGILLLSGGIDSPVAGYLMAKRGLRLDAVYYHSYPYTGREVRDKVQTLAGLLARRIGGLNLHIVPFTEIQVKIRERAPEDRTTLFSRASMMRIADMLAFRRNANSLITGESLSQVASQTPESLRFTGSFASLPVLRPLVGMDKERIIGIARAIGTYETSILPYDDCCVVFASRHPVIRPKFQEMKESFMGLGIEEDLRKALRAAERITIGG